MRGIGAAALALVVGSGVGAAQAPAPPPVASDQTFRVLIDLVTTDVIVRNERGQFLADLTRDEFEVFEDGVKQDLASLTLVHGGRVTGLIAPPPPPSPEGVLLPPARPQNDTAGRIFLFFIDDLHLDFRRTQFIRDLFRRIARDLLHDGDLFAIASTGTSSIAVDLTYDRTRMDEAIAKIVGNGLSPSEIISGPSGSEGPIEVRHRARVAFSTMTEIAQNLEKVRGRRKSVVYVSNGYDFAPFRSARFAADPNSPFRKNEVANFANQAPTAGEPLASSSQRPDPNAPPGSANENFAEANLARELTELTRAANRANATIYTIDPRGVVAGPDIGDNVEPGAWRDYVSRAQDTLRVLAHETGGTAAVNQNDFSDVLKLIDAQTSDYYLLGYYSKTPDPTRSHQIEVNVTRPGAATWSRKSYSPKSPDPASR